jgi:hypothetical protein
MSQQRYRRQDPERTGPIRNFETAFRGSGSGGGPWDPPDDLDGEEAYAAGGGAAGTAGTGPEDFVTSGVRMSYDLLQEQMFRGQDFARQITREFGASVPDLRKLTERVLSFYSRTYMDTVLLWFDLFCPKGIPKQPDKQPVASSVPVTVLSSRPARGAVQLNRPGTNLASLQACQLWTRDLTKPPLMDVAFVTGSSGQVFLRVQVPDIQPPDLYLGVACDRKTGEPLGTIEVEIQQT